MTTRPVSVAARRLARLLSRRELAKKLEVSPQAISLWLSGEGLPLPARMAEIERTYGIPMREWTEAAGPEEDTGESVPDAEKGAA